MKLDNADNDLHEKKRLNFYAIKYNLTTEFLFNETPALRNRRNMLTESTLQVGLSQSKQTVEDTHNPTNTQKNTQNNKRTQGKCTTRRQTDDIQLVMYMLYMRYTHVRREEKHAINLSTSKTSSWTGTCLVT